MRRALLSTALGITLVFASFGVPVVAHSAGKGCVGASVSNEGRGGYRADVIHSWQQDAKNAKMPPGQLGVRWMHSHCGLPTDK
jgi:hypothetical protein